MRIKEKFITSQKPNELILDYEYLYGQNKFPIYIADATGVVTPSKEYLKQIDVLIGRLTAKGFPKFSEIRKYFQEDLSNFDELVGIDAISDVIKAQFTIDDIKKTVELIYFQFVEMETRGVNILIFGNFVNNMQFACEVGGLENLRELLGKITGDSFEEVLYQTKIDFITQIASSVLAKTSSNNQNDNDVNFGRHYHNGMMLAAAEKYNLQLDINDPLASSSNERSQVFLEDLDDLVSTEEGTDLLVDLFTNCLLRRFPPNFNGNLAKRQNILKVIKDQLEKIPLTETNYLLDQILNYGKDSLPKAYKTNYIDVVKLAVRVSLDKQDYINGGVICNGNNIIALNGKDIFFYRNHAFSKFNFSQYHNFKFLIDNLLQSENRDSDILKKIFSYQEDGKTLLSYIIKHCDNEVIKSTLEIISEAGLNDEIIYSRYDLEDNSTPLHLIVTRNNPELVAMIINCGASLYLLDDFGNTVLHVALIKGLSDVIEILIEEGADPTFRNDQNKSPLELGYAEFSKARLKMIFNTALQNKNMNVLINLLKYQNYIEKLKLNNGDSDNSQNLIKLISENPELLEVANRAGDYLRDIADERNLFHIYEVIDQIFADQAEAQQIVQQDEYNSLNSQEESNKKARMDDQTVYSFFQGRYENPFLNNQELVDYLMENRKLYPSLFSKLLDFANDNKEIAEGLNELSPQEIIDFYNFWQGHQEKPANQEILLLISDFFASAHNYFFYPSRHPDYLGPDDGPGGSGGGGVSYEGNPNVTRQSEIVGTINFFAHSVNDTLKEI